MTRRTTDYRHDDNRTTGTGPAQRRSHTNVVGVHLPFEWGDLVLLGKRLNTSYGHAPREAGTRSLRGTRRHDSRRTTSKWSTYYITTIPTITKSASSSSSASWRTRASRPWDAAARGETIPPAWERRVS
jgi:hypothetical protein